MNNISLGQYFPGDSALHRADPRTKIILSISFMAVTLAAGKALELLPLFLLAVTATAVSGISPRTALRALKPILPLVVFAAVVNALATPGDPIFRIWMIAPTREGLRLALFMSARIALVIVGASSLMIYTTTPILLTDGVERLMNPLKRLRVPVHELAMMMTIALRFIPTLIEEADKIMKAQASRGADFNEGNPLDRMRAFVPIVVPLFVSAFRRADDLANAMEARCYRGDEGRTRLRQLRFGRTDAKLCCAFALFVGAFALIKALLSGGAGA